MYETTESQYVATTLPRAATTTITHNSAYESLLPQHQTEQQQHHHHHKQQQQQQQQQKQHKIESEQLQNIYKEYRPTYGAYINNTLPRGPYLQYKFNDQQSAYSKRSDNNQKNRQIELLKHEFMVLPRAKIKISSTNELPSPTNSSNCFNGIQTLGRHRNINQSKQRTPSDGWLPSFDYYNKNDGKKSHWNDDAYDVINQNRNDKPTKLDIPNSIEPVNYNNASYNRNPIKYVSNDNVTANQDYIFCNYNRDTVTKNDYNNKTATATEDIQRRTVLLQQQQQQQIESDHFDMATDLNNFSVKCEPVRYAGGKGRCGSVANRVNFPINYVTLLEIMKVKENGFSQIEGWAILCQSIQALQDLFLADTPSTNRLLPLVNLTNLQITSRGRVVFNVIPAGQMNSDNGVTPFSDTSFLSPEYLSSAGKKTSFSESDIEKMWIYSLGITLHKAIPSTSGITPTISGSLTKINNDRENDDVAVRAPVPSSTAVAICTDMTMYHHYQHHSNEQDKTLTSLDCVISAMCAPKLFNRASLMYLLDVISEYCRCHHQIKPFSHIVMDLFQETIEKSEFSIHSSKFAVNKKTAAFDNRSDTDSGHSSAQGDRDIYAVYSKESDRNRNVVGDKKTLKVSRTATDERRSYDDAPFNKFNPIGCTIQPSVAAAEMEEKPLEPSKRLQVTRRRDEILKRRNRSRRNTIAVNLLDVKRSANLAQSNVSWDGSCSKSTNCIDKIGGMDENGFSKKKISDLGGCSMPELNAMKFSTLPNLKVRRTRETTNSNESINHLVIIKSNGPEFIANSSLSPRAIDITDVKCQHNKRAVIVLLLNGKSIKITCNPAAATAQEIFETVIKCENFVENFFLGICALIGGDFVFLPPDLKIHKVAPEIWFNASKKGCCYTENVIFTLFLRTKFFLPTLRGISSLESRHLLYLQLRKSILESHILCNDEELISLGGLALQSEVGDFMESMKHSDYFTISHYLPEGVYQRNKAMAKYLRNSHYSKKGLHSRESEYNFIRYVQEMKEYGLHLFSAVWATDDGLTYDVYVAVSLSGIRIFRRSSTSSRQDQPNDNSKRSKTDFQRKLYANFDWLEIENLCFSKHILCVVIRKSESLKAKDNNRVKYKFRMDGRKSYFAFHLASEHHRFYMKLRNSFISLKALSDELNYPLNAAMTVQTATNHQPNPMEASAPNADHFQSNCINMDEPNPMEASDKSAEKSAAGRVGIKLKKSMLNDNRLTKLRNKFLKRSKSSVGKERICLNPNGHSMEENQNKENECPKIELKQSHNLLLSPNRNRVKMGTRVFSAQFLNKSIDNVSDSNGFNMYRIDSSDCLDVADDRGKSCAFGQCEREYSDDGMSVTSTSLSSLYYSEKMSEKFSPSPLPTEAYVIQSSMRSNCDINQFSMFNETISDSLFEKFNNLSRNNTIGDRIISRITVIKDGSHGRVEGNRKFSLDSDGQSSVEDNGSVANKLTLGISIVQGSDNNVYVKDLVKNGPGARNGIQIGDQILAVNGKSLLNLSYSQSLSILQNTSSTVELTVSQIYRKPDNEPPTKKQVVNGQPVKTSTVRSITRSMKNSFKFRKDRKDIGSGKAIDATSVQRMNSVNDNYHKYVEPQQPRSSSGHVADWNCKNGNEKSSFKGRSMPDLPKVVGTIPKHQNNDKGTLPRTMGLSRKYVGPVRYPVTPIRPSSSAEKQQRLSLLADNVDKQVFI